MENFDTAQFAAELVDRQIDRPFTYSAGIIKGAKQAVIARLSYKYTQYLKNVSRQLSKTKTFLLQDQAHDLYDFYVPLTIASGGHRIKKVTSSLLSKAASLAIITGTGGIGKTTLLKHLFLGTLAVKDKVPVFVELRHATQVNGNLSSMILSTLANNGLDLEERYLLAALHDGAFSLFLDGFDEIDHDLRDSVSEQIEGLSLKSPNMRIAITSRPDNRFSKWSTFRVFDPSPVIRRGCGACRKTTTGRIHENSVYQGSKAIAV